MSDKNSQISVFQEGSGWKWKLYSTYLQRELRSTRTYKDRWGAMRAGRRVYSQTYGPSLTGVSELRWYRVVAKVNGWAITLGFLVNAPTAKAANAKAQAHIDADPKLGRWARVLNHGCRLADEKARDRMIRDFPKSVIA